MSPPSTRARRRPPNSSGSEPPRPYGTARRCPVDAALATVIVVLVVQAAHASRDE
jgi:hypothetical protein